MAYGRTELPHGVQSFILDKESGLPGSRLNMAQQNQFKVHNDEVYEKRRVHSFKMSDVDDPELYAAQPIWEWQQTDHGKWVMTHSLDPTFHVMSDHLNWGYRILIEAWITPKRWTEYCLRFVDKDHV
jgi:hypothetical protein